jgi:hypothetical protein
MKGLAMTSYQASLWREMAKEAGAAADRVQDPGVRREMWSMAARYMAMAERVEVWAAAERAAIEPDEAN